MGYTVIIKLPKKDMKLLEHLSHRIDKIVLSVAIAVLTLSLYLVYALNQHYTQKETIASLDTMLQFTRNMLDEEQQHALSLSVLLSQDRELLRAYFDHDRNRTFSIIQHKLESLQRMQGYTFEVQVHDRQLCTYLRSWDFTIQGEPLAGFREGLVIVRDQHHPLVSIEVGKRLNIKAISPILRHRRFEGSIEVIEGFAHLRKRLSEQGYHLYVLLDKKYLPIALTLQEAPILSEKFALVGTVRDVESFDALCAMSLDDLGSFGYFTSGKHLFGYFDLRNYHNDRLGYLLITPVNTVRFSAEARHSASSIQQSNKGVIIR
jgi:hypothetical protein